MNTPLVNDPISSTHSGPTASVVDSAGSRVEAVATLLTDEGHSNMRTVDAVAG